MSVSSRQRSSSELLDWLDSSPSAIGVYQADRWEYCNAAMLRLLGLQRADELLGQSCSTLAGTGLDHFPCTIGRSEFDYLRPDGNRIYIEVTGTPCTFLGEPAIQFTCQDVTPVHAALKRLKRKETALANTERLARVGSWAYYVRDDNAGSVYLSEEARRILQLPLAGAVTIAQLHDLLHPDDLLYMQTWLQQARLGAVEHTLDQQVRFYLPDCPETLLHIRGIVTFHQGKLKRIKGIIHDITQQKQEEDRLRTAENMVLQSDKLQAVGQLAAGIAHEIRNPLTALKGFIRLLPTASPYSTAMYTGIMKDELERIERIVNEMLELAKPHNVNFTRIELERVLREVMTLIEAQTLMQNVQIVMETTPKLPSIIGCDDQLKQAILNIIKNALEAMPDGGMLEIKLHPEGGSVHLAVTDTGVGMSADTIRRLGQPFYTTKLTGTGLGVLITKQIVDTHKGTITYHSELGKGTTVTVAFPAAAEHEIERTASR